MDYLKKVYRSYGTNYFDRDKFKKVYFKEDSYFLNKPQGGFWGSYKKGAGSWYEFCQGENFKVDTLKKHVDFKIKRWARVLVLEEFDDLRFLPKLRYNKIWGLVPIDWELLSEEYDIIIVNAPRIKAECWANGAIDALTSWDVFSVLVCNPKAIYIVGKEG